MNFKSVLLAALLLAAFATLTAQTVLTPDKIDPYTFDPLANPANYGAQALTAYGAGQYETAAKLYLAHLQTRPDDSDSWYNLACCFGLLGKTDQAAKYLMQAYKAGFTNLDHIKADTDFNSVKSSPAFTAAMDSLNVWSERRARYDGRQEYLKATHLMPFRLHLPKDFDPNRGYTLLIGLHGYGDTAPSFSRLWRWLENEDLIYAVPEAPYPFTEGKIGFSWRPFADDFSEASLQSSDLVGQYILDLKARLSATYKIRETWLLGFSEGAFMAYLLGLKRPAQYAGIVACGGGLLSEAVSVDEFAAARDLKVIISHGTQDRVIPLSMAASARETLEQYRFKNLRYVEFEGGHSVSPTAIEAFLEWQKQP